MKTLVRFVFPLTFAAWAVCLLLQAFAPGNSLFVKLSWQLADALTFACASPVLLAFYLFGHPIDWPLGSSAGHIALALAASVLWLALISLEGRFRRMAGFYDPFADQYKPRPRMLRWLVGRADWWNKIRHFGKQKTARFASLPEVLGNAYRSGDIFLGRPRLFTNGGLLGPAIGISTDKHLLLLAEPGAHKTTGFAVPALCSHEGSALVIDVVGELTQITAARRGQGGDGVRPMDQAVFKIDPFGIVSGPAGKGAMTASFNVFDEMVSISLAKPERAIAYAHNIAEALLKPSSGVEDNFFENSARSFLAALVLWVFSGPADKRNLRRLRQLLVEGDVAAYKVAVAEGRVKDGDLNTPFTELLVNMQTLPDGMYRQVIAGSAATLLQMGERQRGAVITTAIEGTMFLDYPEILNCTDTSDFSLEDFKTKKQTVYLCMPVNEVQGKCSGFLRLFVICFIKQMMTDLEAPKLPVLLLLDEMPALGHIQDIEKIAPLARKYGIRLAAIGQDISQFKAVYPRVWESFVGAADVQIMKVKHPTTVAYVKGLLGQRNVTGHNAEGKAIAHDAPLLDEEQIPRFLAGGNQIVWRGTTRSMRLKVCPYFWYLPYWAYTPDPRFKEPFLRAWFRRQAAGKPATKRPHLAKI